MNDPVLSLQDVTKTYGDFTAVSEVSFSIPHGSIYGFLGPNGAGKTTIIRMILDILRPDSGQIAVLGHDSAMAVRNRIGYLPEEKGLYKKMKVWAIISYFASLKGLDRKTAKRRAHELLEKYGLADFAEAKVESLSKGMGQKVQVISAIAHDPELIILDEPFSGLDPVNQEVLEQLIRDIASEGRTIIFSTHIMQHAERLCDRLLLITGGRKIFDGTVSEARSIIPRRVTLQTATDITHLQSLPGVLAVHRNEEEDDAGEPTWDLHLEEHSDPQSILRLCFEQNMALTRFDYTRASLHDVFVHLVGHDAGEQTFR
ncbi:MAG: ATP-binding cassette domain-containing protein [Pseudohongiellaceae bacterium]